MRACPSLGVMVVNSGTEKTASGGATFRRWALASWLAVGLLSFPVSASAATFIDQIGQLPTALSSLGLEPGSYTLKLTTSAPVTVSGVNYYFWDEFYTLGGWDLGGDSGEGSDYSFGEVGVINFEIPLFIQPDFISQAGPWVFHFNHSARWDEFRIQGAAGTNYHLSVTGHLLFPNVPEPSTWALLVLGFGSVGAVIRRRRCLLVTA